VPAIKIRPDAKMPDARSSLKSGKSDSWLALASLAEAATAVSTGWPHHSCAGSVARHEVDAKLLADMGESFRIGKAALRAIRAPGQGIVISWYFGDTTV
jgi:hypothetical protein